MGGHSADRVAEEECSVCFNRGSWRSLALCYWGQYLVVVKRLESDCSRISASLGVTLEVNLMSHKNSLQVSVHVEGNIRDLIKFLCLLIRDLFQKKKKKKV